MSQSFFDGGNKTMFFSGLFLGVAASALIGFGLVFSLVWNGSALGAGLAAGGNGGTVVPSIPSQPSAPAAPAGPVKPFDAKTDWAIGANNAKVTLIEYSDFQCPFCQRHLPSVKQALADYPNDVRLVYRHYPLSFHPEAQKSGEASECAGKLGGNEKFWAMHDELFANQSLLGRQMYIDTAKKIGLNEANFTKCLDSGETASQVSEDAASGNAAGVEGTPATYVNGALISGAVPYAELKAAIDAALKK